MHLSVVGWHPDMCMKTKQNNVGRGNVVHARTGACEFMWFAILFGSVDEGQSGLQHGDECRASPSARKDGRQQCRNRGRLLPSSVNL